ncbi:PepSY domain-containing protein [Arenimonas alkanexedens]
MKTPALLLAVSLTLAATTAVAQPTQAPIDVTERLKSAGYAEVRDIEFDDGLWEAEVRHADGRWHDVALDPATGELMDNRSQQALLGIDEVLSRLASAGYTQVQDLDLDDAVWEADALATDGRRIELRINAHTGRVLSEQIDD